LKTLISFHLPGFLPAFAHGLKTFLNDGFGILDSCSGKFYLKLVPGGNGLQSYGMP